MVSGGQGVVERWAAVYGLAVRSGVVYPVPEPATMLLMGTGLAGLIGARRKKKA